MAHRESLRVFPCDGPGRGGLVRTGETDEPQDDSMSVGDLSDMESEWDPYEFPEEFQVGPESRKLLSSYKHG